MIIAPRERYSNAMNDLIINSQTLNSLQVS